jgi:hypothetical protein
MDFARPSGVVLHESVGFRLLPSEIQQKFLTDNIYVRGIAEEKPLTVYYTKDLTIIPPRTRTPLSEPEWNTEIFSMSFGNLCSLIPDVLEFDLEKTPLDANQIVVEVFHQPPQGGTISKLYSLSDEGLSLGKKGQIIIVNLQKKFELKRLAKYNLGKDAEINFRISYPNPMKRQTSALYNSISS